VDGDIIQVGEYDLEGPLQDVVIVVLVHGSHRETPAGPARSRRACSCWRLRWALGRWGAVDIKYASRYLRLPAGALEEERS